MHASQFVWMTPSPVRLLQVPSHVTTSPPVRNVADRVLIGLLLGSVLAQLRTCGLHAVQALHQPCKRTAARHHTYELFPSERLVPLGSHVYHQNHRHTLARSHFLTVGNWNTTWSVDAGEVRKIDNGYLVAWSAGMEWTIAQATNSLAATVLSGEGFVCRFKGPGTVFVQTRSLKNLAMSLRPYLPSGGGGGGDSSASS